MGGIYKGHRPVLWSVVEKTALADAEVEYEDHKSTTIYTSFPVSLASNEKLQDHSIVIWTTTLLGLSQEIGHWLSMKISITFLYHSSKMILKEM